jgi:predicted PurR-regulated permease PerM
VAGVGYFFALPREAPLFLLTALTMVFAIVPFVGAALVWVPTCAYLAFFDERMVDGAVVVGNWPVALMLAVYCGVVVSNVDNVVKPWVLHGQTNLHPLLALLSVIGGVQALGPIGILVGPMLVAFLQALMNMLNHELKMLGKEADQLDTPGMFATGGGSESAALSPPAQPQEQSRSKRRKGKKK